MGVIGLFSYAGASIQEFVSGVLINSGKTVLNGKTIYNFSHPADFWVLASVGACLLPLLVWNAKPQEGSGFPAMKASQAECEPLSKA